MGGDTVAYEFIRMPELTGFGDYTKTGQVIPVRFKTKHGAVQEGEYVHAELGRFAVAYRSPLGELRSTTLRRVPGSGILGPIFADPA